MPSDSSIRSRWVFPDVSGWKPAAAIAAVAFAVLAPNILYETSFGPDTNFHLTSWMEVARQWHQGVIYPRWHTLANYGFGEPRFVFYPPASWILGALLGWLLSWKLAAGAFAWVSLTAAGACMYKLAREWLSPGQATGVAVLYAANPYFVMLVYVRASFAELLAGALLPLLVLAALRIGRTGRDGFVLFALATASLWLVNLPAALLSLYYMTLFLAVRAVRERSFRPLVLGGGATALGLALVAFYLLPAFYEQRWVHIAAAQFGGLRLENNFLFMAILSAGRRGNLTASGLAMAELALLGGTLAATRKAEPRLREVLWLLQGLALLAIAMMLRPSLPVWQALPWIRLVQLPWRALSLVSLALALAAGAMASRDRLGGPWAAFIALVWIGLAVGVLSRSWWDAARYRQIIAGMERGSGSWGALEYTPSGTDVGWLHNMHVKRWADSNQAIDPPGSIVTQDSAGVIHASQEKWAPEEIVYSVETAAPARLVLRLFYYPAWRVEVNGRPVTAETQPVTGQIVVPLPAGSSHLRVWFERTPDRTAGMAISLGALALVLFLLLGGTKTAAQLRSLAVPIASVSSQ